MRRVALTSLFVFALFASVSSAQPARLTGSEIEARVEALFEKWDRADTPGCALGVAQSGQTLLSRAWGMADLEHAVKNTPETIFEAGSVSKQFTAAAVLLLAQSMRLSLDDQVRKHIPELPDYGAPLTIRQTWCQCQPGDSRPVTGRSTSSMATAGCVPPTSSAP